MDSADDPRARPGTVDVLGLTLEVGWNGPGPDEAPTIVFLHEGLGSVSTWRDFPARLAAVSGCGALVYGRAGHGGSSASRGPRSIRYLHEEALDVLPAVLDRFELVRPFLFGHSDGATIALLYAAAHPSCVRALVAEAPHVFVEEEALAGIRRAADAYASTGLRDRLSRHHGPATDALFAAWSGIWLSAGFRAWNVEDALGSIACPVLVVQGEDDEYGTLRQVESILSRVPGARSLVLPSCGHAPHAERRDGVLAAAGAFFREHRDPSS